MVVIFAGTLRIEAQIELVLPAKFEARLRERIVPNLRARPALGKVRGMAMASLVESKTPWADYAGDYDLIRDKMAHAIDGFEDFNRRVRQPLGFRLKQPARELVFLTDTGKANFSTAPLAEVAPAPGRLLLGTIRSHDQWNTTIYSDDDRYRGVKNLRTLVFMIGATSVTPGRGGMPQSAVHETLAAAGSNAAADINPRSRLAPGVA